MDVLVCAAVLLLSCTLAWALSPHCVSTDAMSTVKVVDTGGEARGTAVHIGDGFLLTAAHVVGEERSLDIVDSRDNEQQAPVLWSSAKYDVALARVPDPRRIAVSRLDCGKRAPEGTPVTVVGHPLGMKFVATRGHIASNLPHSLEGSPAEWRVVDITVAPGNSGGPVFDAAGKVVGLVSAGAWSPGGFGRRPMPFPITLMVPAKVACNLMGRR
jgi:S1-C subfamily serine protease